MNISSSWRETVQGQRLAAGLLPSFIKAEPDACHPH
jgi:hypothetical protein